MMPIVPLWQVVAILAAVAASPLRPVSLREFALVLVGILMAVTWNRSHSSRGRVRRPTRTPNNSDSDTDILNNEHVIRTIGELRQVLPAGLSGTCLEDAKKVIGCLDDQMMDFIAQSPLLYLATYDSITGTPFVSPKGDEPGFVRVITKKNSSSSNNNNNNNVTPQHVLVIPDRPGNRLLFGLQNIVGGDTQNNPTTNSTTTTPSQASVLFEVPGSGSTLRCGGPARLSEDPLLLRQHVARGCPPKLVILVEVHHAFFHCAKAYLRSRVWDPTSWPADAEKPKVTFGRYFAKKESFLAKRIDSDVDKHYQQIQKAVDGEACEQEK